MWSPTSPPALSQLPCPSYRSPAGRRIFLTGKAVDVKGGGKVASLQTRWVYSSLFYRVFPNLSWREVLTSSHKARCDHLGVFCEHPLCPEPVCAGSRPSLVRTCVALHKRFTAGLCHLLSRDSSAVLIWRVSKQVHSTAGHSEGPAGALLSGCLWGPRGSSSPSPSALCHLRLGTVPVFCVVRLQWETVLAPSDRKVSGIELQCPPSH